MIKAFSNLIHRVKSFDWFSILMYHERIAGLAIDARAVRYAVFERNKKTGAASMSVTALELLPQGTIVAGKVANSTALAKSLTALYKKVGSKAESVVLSLPSELFFTLNLSFPKNLSGDEVREAVDLNITYLLPVPREDVYVDFEKVEDGSFDKQGIFLVLGEKKYIDPYLVALETAKFTTVATEPSFASAARMMIASEEKSLGGRLLIKISREGVHSTIVRGGTVRFTRFTLLREGDVAVAVANEAKRILNFYGSDPAARGEGEDIRDVFIFGSELLPSSFTDEASKTLEIPVHIIDVEKLLLKGLSIAKDQNIEFFEVFGAATRGAIDRAKDTMVSIMAVGTEQAYEERRAISFAKFLRGLTYGLSVFFLVILGAVYGLLYFMNSSASQDLLQAVVPQNIIDLESKAVEVNIEIRAMSAIREATPYWSEFLNTFKGLTNPGITVQKIQLSAPQGPVNLTFYAVSVDVMLQYKRTLEGSGLFQEIKIPFSALSQRENITVTLPLLLKDPSKVKHRL